MLKFIISILYAVDIGTIHTTATNTAVNATSTLVVNDDDADDDDNNEDDG